MKELTEDEKKDLALLLANMDENGMISLDFLSEFSGIDKDELMRKYEELHPHLN